MRRALFMLWAVMRKEFRQTVRDRRMVALLVAAPVVQLVLFGSAVQLDVDHVPTLTLDLDDSHASRAHRRRVMADGTLQEVGILTRPDEALRLLEIGDAAAVLVIPRGFERDVLRARAARVQMLLDGTDPNRANVASSAVAAYFAGESAALERARAARSAATLGRRVMVPEVSVRSRVLFNPALKSATYMVPGVAAMLLLLVTTIVASMGLARERERGPLEQIQVTPVPASILMLGKIIPFAVVGLFDFMLALVVGAFGFDMPIRGSISLLFAATILYLTNTLSIGLLISTVSSSQQQAFMGGFLFMLPAALLSGIMTPVRSMPEWLAPLTLANPLRHYAEILRAVLLRGASFAQVSTQLLALLAMGICICAVAAVRFRRQQG